MATSQSIESLCLSVTFWKNADINASSAKKRKATEILKREINRTKSKTKSRTLTLRPQHGKNERETQHHLLNILIDWIHNQKTPQTVRKDVFNALTILIRSFDDEIILKHKNDILKTFGNNKYISVNAMIELFIKVRFDLNSDECLPYLLDALLSKKNTVQQSGMKFIIKCAIFPQQMMKLFENDEIIEIMMKNTKSKNKDVMQLATQCIGVVMAIYNDQCMNNDYKMNPLLTKEYELLKEQPHAKELIFKDIEWNKYIDFDDLKMENNSSYESLWYMSLKSGDKIDAQNKKGEWKITTVANIYNIDDENEKNGKLFHVCFPPNRDNDTYTYVYILCNVITCIYNKIQPLNVYSAFHQYLDAYNDKITFCASSDHRHCVHCQELFCTKCALFSIDEDTYECRKCSIAIECKTIFDIICDTFVDKYCDTNAIHLIIEYALGQILQCCKVGCESQDIWTSRCIYFNNRYEFINHIDVNGDYIHYYEATDINTLKQIKLSNGTKLRIFCHSCTSPLRITRLSSKKRVYRCEYPHCGNNDVIMKKWGFGLTFKKICYNHPQCDICNRLRAKVTLCTQCKKRMCDGIECGIHEKCVFCAISTERKERFDSIRESKNLITQENIINLIVDYSMGYIFKCCNKWCSYLQDIYIENTFKFLSQTEESGNKISYYILSRDNTSDIYRWFRGQKIRIFCGECSGSLWKCRKEDCNAYDVSDAMKNTHSKYTAICYNH